MRQLVAVRLIPGLLPDLSVMLLLCGRARVTVSCSRLACRGRRCPMNHTANQQLVRLSDGPVYDCHADVLIPAGGKGTIWVVALTCCPTPANGEVPWDGFENHGAADRHGICAIYRRPSTRLGARPGVGPAQWH